MRASMCRSSPRASTRCDAVRIGVVRRGWSIVTRMHVIRIGRVVARRGLNAVRGRSGKRSFSVRRLIRLMRSRGGGRRRGRRGGIVGSRIGSILQMGVIRHMSLRNLDRDPRPPRARPLTNGRVGTHSRKRAREVGCVVRPRHGVVRRGCAS